MNDLPPTPRVESEAIQRIKGVKALRVATPGMSLKEAVQRWDAGERGDDTDVWEYAWRWADKDDDANRSFNQSMTRDSIMEWCREQEHRIAPVTLVRRPRAQWVEVDFR